MILSVLAEFLPWGSVSDWVMVTVTTVTLYFLYKTLQSQKDVQATQNSLLEIEQFRLQTDIRPDLQYAVFTDLYSEELGETCIAIAVLNRAPAMAVDVRAVFNDSGSMIMTTAENPPLNLKNDGKYLRLYFIFTLDAKPNHFSFTMNFDDTAGTRYMQFVLCWLESGTAQIEMYTPRVISAAENK